MSSIQDTICYFCDISSHKTNILVEDEDSLVLSDNFPISSGHTLIVPKLHEQNIFKLTPNLYAKLFTITKEYSSILLENDETIQGFNIGVNQGSVAGQTIMHAHIHLIPRRDGDMPDPRGGIRWIFPEKAKYQE